jgi:thiol:disulfide interchange protein
MKTIEKLVAPQHNRAMKSPLKDTLMRKTTALILGTVTTAIAICGLTYGQSSPARRTPALTNDDLRSVPREVVSLPTEADENEPKPASTRTREIARGSITWQRDLNRAFDVARAEGKLIVVDVYTDWCGWCKKMDKAVYADPSIVALSRQQVFLKLNAEDRGQGQAFARQMGVSGYPTTIILDGQAKVLQVAEGYIPSTQAFLEFFEKGRSQAR